MGFVVCKIKFNLVMESVTRKGREDCNRSFAIPWPFYMEDAMLFFKDAEDLKEFHQSLLRDHERGVKFIESNIEYHKKMAEIYKGSIYQGNRKMVQFHLDHLKKSETDLQEAKEKQKKAVEKYEAIYLTTKEKAARKGLTVISGGLNA